MTVVDPTGHYARSDHGTSPHQLVILTAQDPAWIEHLAQRYQDLRTASRLPDPSLLTRDPLDGIEALDPSELRRRLIQTQVPSDTGGNFSVVRSDLAEVLLNLVGSVYGGFEYGYESIRDRETANLPGRSIDQIGVRLDEGEQVLHLMLGEAKASRQARHPPRVVDANDDSLSKSHTKQLQDRATTVGKIFHAYRFCTDPVVARNFALAATMFETQNPQLTVHVTSVLLRSGDTAHQDDFGSYASNPDQFSPSVVDFYIVSSADMAFDEMVRTFGELAHLDVTGDDDDDEDAIEDDDDAA